MSERHSRILVAEDSPLLRTILADTLSRYGYAVETVENGQEAIECFASNPPDLVLMDADMPVLDGVNACAKIRRLAQARYVRIIIVTGHDEQDWVDRAYAAGATDYIMKPINWDVLRNRIQYILQAKKAEEALFDEKEKAQVTLESIADGVITTDAENRVEYMNPIAQSLSGWDLNEARGQPLTDVFTLIDEESEARIDIPFPAGLPSDRRLTKAEQIMLLHRNGEQCFAIEESAAPIRARSGIIIGMVLVFHDVTENRQLNREIAYQASHDPLTQLLNRREFKRRLQQLSEHAKADNSTHSLLYLDLDRFKIVNDTCGHEAGDMLLRQIATVLQQPIRAQDTLARLGGDEFGVLLERCDREQGLHIAEKLRQGVEEYRFSWQKHVFTIGVSIGLVEISAAHGQLNELLSMADSACYQAKDTGRNRIVVYQPQVEEQQQEMRWLQRLDSSFAEDRFALYYQPIFSLAEANAGTAFHHCEILVRMEDNEGQPIPPGAFFSTAERYNLLSKLDRWVVLHTLNWLYNQLEQNQTIQRVSINIAARSLTHPGFVRFIAQQLETLHISPRCLCFELNEVDVLNHLIDAEHFIKELKELGCCFALDDFGSGLSAFSYLKALPLDFVKIHGSFIGSLEDSTDYAIVQAINQISHVMGMQTIAEAVETQAALYALQRIGVDYAQGYLFGQPQPLPPQF